MLVKNRNFRQKYKSSSKIAVLSEFRGIFVNIFGDIILVTNIIYYIDISVFIKDPPINV